MRIWNTLWHWKVPLEFFGRRRDYGRCGHSSRHSRIEVLEQRTLLSLDGGTSEVLDASRLDWLVNEGLLIPADRGSYLFTGRVDEGTLTLNLDAAVSTNTDELWSGGSIGVNLTGSGLTVGVWDGGAVRSTHEAVEGRVTVVDTAGNSDHSTHVAGTIGSDGVDDPDAHGMATAIEIRSRTYADDRTEFPSDAASNLIDLSNHSYGNLRGWTNRISWGGLGDCDTWVADRDNFTEDPFFGKYEVNPNVVDASLHAMGWPRVFSAGELDDALYDNPDVLSIWSAGNDTGEDFQDGLGGNLYMTYRSQGGGGAGWYLVSTGNFPAPAADGNDPDGDYDCLPQTQTAKNSLVVGSIGDLPDNYTINDIEVSAFSSRGATDDGRIKPDVMGNGEVVYSSGSLSDSHYYNSSGTSMSAPNVTGTAALLMEHYEDEFGDLPRAATTKAMIIHTVADDALYTGPDYTHGWGVVDSEAAATFVSDAADGGGSDWLSEEVYLGGEWRQPILWNQSDPIKATIVWTDPAGDANTGGLDDDTPALVNDLDLWITGPGGTYYPWSLDPDNPANAAVRTTANHRDNVEQVLIDSPGAGTYTIHVGHTDSLATSSQYFSIMLSGAGLDPGTEVDAGEDAGDEVADTFLMCSSLDDVRNCVGFTPLRWSFARISGGRVRKTLTAVGEQLRSGATLLVANLPGRPVLPPGQLGNGGQAL